MRIGFWRPIAVAVAAVLIAVGVAPAAHGATPQDDLAALANDQRSSAGVRQLISDGRLNAVAQEWAETMSRTNRMEHSSGQWRSERLQPGWTANSEQIARGYTTPRAVMDGWMGSPAHRASILSDSYTRIGVGFVSNGDYWVQILAGYPERPVPFGWFDTASISGSSLDVSGWAIDPESPRAAIPVHVWVADPVGQLNGYAITADRPRPDVGAVYPRSGGGHGYATSIALVRAGNYNVCSYAIGALVNTPLGCKQVAWNPSNPTGLLDDVSVVVQGSTRSITSSGWALDQNARAATTQVHVHVFDPSGRLSVYPLSSSVARQDVALAFPGAGPDHGFRFSTQITTAGEYTVCTYALGAPPHEVVYQSLGCRRVRLLPSSPIGFVDSVSANSSARTISVSGWTMDDGARSVSNEAHVYITAPNGVTTGKALVANQTRVDVGQHFPGAGSAHGYSLTTPVTVTGTYRVCVWSIAAPQLAPGNRLLPCRDVTV